MFALPRFSLLQMPSIAPPLGAGQRLGQPAQAFQDRSSGGSGDRLMLPVIPTASPPYPGLFGSSSAWGGNGVRAGAAAGGGEGVGGGGWSNGGGVGSGSGYGGGGYGSGGGGGVGSAGGLSGSGGGGGGGGGSVSTGSSDSHPVGNGPGASTTPGQVTRPLRVVFSCVRALAVHVYSRV